MKHIYVITMKGHPYCKVGMTNDLKRRLDQHQCGNPCKLEVAFSVSVDEEIASLVEVQTHKLLEAWKANGEWFEVSADKAFSAIKESASIISSQCTSNGFPRSIRQTLFSAFRIKNGLSQKQAAERLGVSQSLIARMESEERFAVSPKMAIQLDRRSNGELRREELRPDIFGEVAA